MDVCIIGAGPVGLSMALSLARRGMTVHLLEAGGREPTANASGAFGFDVVDQLTHAEAALSSRQGLGGTSSVWGGGCMPFGPLDLSPRAHIPMSGSPISYADFAAHHEEAGDLLGIDGRFPDPYSANDPDAQIDLSSVMRISRVPDTSVLHRAEIESLENLRLYLNTRAVDLAMDPASGAVTSVRVESRGELATLAPKVIILCCGGIQSTRLLLLMQREHPALLGGDAGPLGRYYNGHVSGAAARIRFNRPQDARRFILHQTPEGALERNCIALAAGLQMSKRLCNLYFGLTRFPLGDPGYRSGALSAIHLALCARHQTAHYMPYYHSGHVQTEFEFGVNLLAHLRNMVRRPERTIKGVAEVLREKRRNASVGPFARLYNASGIYGLRYHAEQLPDPDSRVVLSDKTDDRGVPLPSIELRISETDITSVLASHEHLDRWLRGSGLGRIEWHQPKAQRFAQIKSQSSDGYHQMGSTRMASTERAGVVDKDLKVHGLRNLYIAAPSVLPTGGRAHPTFPTVTLAVRLASHLAAHAQAGF